MDAAGFFEDLAVKGLWGCIAGIFKGTMGIYYMVRFTGAVPSILYCSYEKEPPNSIGNSLGPPYYTPLRTIIKIVF